MSFSLHHHWLDTTFICSSERVLSQDAQDSSSPSQSQDARASLQSCMFIFHSSSIFLHKFPTLITWILTDNHFSLALARNWKQGIAYEHKMGIDDEGKIFNIINAP